MILGHDPGMRPGYSWHDTDDLIGRRVLTCNKGTPRIVAASTRYNDHSSIKVDTIATEGQWIHASNSRTKKDHASPANILKLAFTAGFQACRAHTEWDVGTSVYRLPPEGKRSWFSAFYRCAHVTQDVLVARIEQQLDPAELRILNLAAGKSKLRRRDILASIGIGWALFLSENPQEYLIPIGE